MIAWMIAIATAAPRGSRRREQVGQRPQQRGDQQADEHRDRDEVQAPEGDEHEVDGDGDGDRPPRVSGGDPQPVPDGLVGVRVAAARGARRPGGSRSRAPARRHRGPARGRTARAGVAVSAAACGPGRAADPSSHAPASRSPAVAHPPGRAGAAAARRLEVSHSSPSSASRRLILRSMTGPRETWRADVGEQNAQWLATECRTARLASEYRPRDLGGGLAGGRRAGARGAAGAGRGGGRVHHRRRRRPAIWVGDDAFELELTAHHP